MAETSTSHPNVMVIDDDPDILEIMKLTLESSGFSATTACGGAAALARLRAGILPKVILLDMMMPDVDGWAFRSEQEKDAALRDIPVIVMTADQQAEEKAQQVGAVGCLKKPVGIDELLEKVSPYCRD